MKSFLIIGMGTFGHHLCRALCKMKCEVMIADQNGEALEDMLPYVAAAKICDCANIEVLRSFGVQNFDACFVCVNKNFQACLEITDQLKELGAKRCLPLKVSGPFHTSLLAPAGDALREKFKETAFGAMRIPVLFNCLGREMGPEDTIPALLEKQVQTSVYMEDTIRRLAELGVDTIVEIGPGKALIGFVKKTAPAIKTYAVETCADLDALSAALKG